MHLSMHNWMRVEPLDRTCERLAQCGYESIEIMGEPEEYATARQCVTRSNAMASGAGGQSR